MKPSFAASLKRAVGQPTFLLVAGVLFLAALGLNAATQAMQLHFKKKPVPLAAPLHESENGGVARELGAWLQATRDEPLDHTMLEALGTRDFVFRTYVNTAVADPSLVEELKDLSPGEAAAAGDLDAAKRERQRRQELLGRIAVQNPESVVMLSLTYYTGMVDTVPHIPDRCMIADGYEPVGYDVRSGTFGAYADGSPRQVEYRSIRFEDDTDQKRVNKNVVYFFHVNGRYESDPQGVRVSLQNLRERYGYFAKIEMLSTHPDRAVAEAAMNDLMAAALPDIERALPDWEKYKAAK